MLRYFRHNSSNQTKYFFMAKFFMCLFILFKMIRRAKVIFNYDDYNDYIKRFTKINFSITHFVAQPIIGEN